MTTNRKKLLITAISVILVIPFLFCLGLDTDEPYTLGFIHNSYSSIINLSKFDIHPPLYYLILKFFVSLLNIVTKNIFITIIFARIISLIFAIITFIYLVKIIKLLSFKISNYISLIVFVLTPSVIGFVALIASLRMYTLAMMLISMEIFYLLKFSSSYKYKYPVIISILTAASLYTHYFAGLYSGLLIIFFALYKLINKEYKYVITYMIVGLASLALFIPWLPSLKYQLHLQATTVNGNTLKTAIPYVLIIGIISLVTYVILKKYTDDLLGVIFNILFFLILITLVIFLTVKINSPRYVAPILVPYFFISCMIALKNINNSKIPFAFLSIIFLLGYGQAVHHEIFKMNIQSIHFIKDFNKIKKQKSKNINVHEYGLDKYYWDKKYGGGGGNAIYLESIGKKIDDKNYISTYQVLGNGNVKLFKAVFPNVEHFTTVNPSIKKSNNK